MTDGFVKVVLKDEGEGSRCFTRDFSVNAYRFLHEFFCANTNLFLLHLLFHQDGFFLVFAPFVLEPHSDHPRTETGHFH